MALEGLRQVGLFQNLAHRPGLPALEEDARPVGITGHVGTEPAGPERSVHRRGHGETSLGVLDRRGQDFRPGHRAVPLKERRPTREVPGDERRHEAVTSGVGPIPEAASRREGFGVRSGGRGADEIHRPDFRLLGVVDQRVAADAAQPGHERLHYGEHRRTRHRRVKGVASRLQHPEPGLCGERVRSHHHAVDAHASAFSRSAERWTEQQPESQPRSRQGQEESFRAHPSASYR